MAGKWVDMTKVLWHQSHTYSDSEESGEEE